MKLPEAAKLVNSFLGFAKKYCRLNRHFFLELQHIHVYWTICKLNIKRSRTKLRFHNHYVIYLRSSKEYDQQQYYLNIRVWRSFLSWKSTYIPCFSYSKWAHGGCHIRRYLRQINDRTAKKKKIIVVFSKNYSNWLWNVVSPTHRQDCFLNFTVIYSKYVLKSRPKVDAY